MNEEIKVGTILRNQISGNVVVVVSMHPASVIIGAVECVNAYGEITHEISVNTEVIGYNEEIAKLVKQFKEQLSKELLLRSPAQLLNYIDGDLGIAITSDAAYVYDRYRLGERDYDYGIMGKFSIEDLRDGKLDVNLVPDYKIEQLFEDLINDDILQQLPDADKDTLVKKPYSEWAEILNEKGYKSAARELGPLCKWLETGTVAQMTSRESAHYCKAGERIKDYIDLYENRDIEELKDEPER